MIGQDFRESSGKYANPEVNTFSEARGVEVKRPYNIGTEIVELRDLVTQAHELLTVLEERTRPVRNNVPQSPEKDGQAIRGGSELRCALGDQNDRLRSLVSRIAVMADEIDL